MTPYAAPQPSPESSPAPKSEDAEVASGMAQGILEFFKDNPKVLVPLILWIGVLYGWKQVRTYFAQRGKPVAPLGDIVGRVIRFALKEDTDPVISKPQKVAAKLTWLTGKRLYLLLALWAVVGHFTGIVAVMKPIMLLALILGMRARKVFRMRWGIMMQMFAVAAAECKYPKEAPLNPWGYIKIQGWEGATRPGTTIVTYPAAYQSEEIKTREKFERQFNGTVSDEHSWGYKWESSKNRVTCTPTPHLPTMAKYPGPGPKWNEFHIGVAGEGEIAKWDVSTFPHSLICGPTGSGKSVLQRMILFHALAHSDTWKIVGVDPKMVEMGWLKAYPSVLKVALTLEEGVEVVRSVRDEMMRRYDEMSQLGINHFQKMDPPPPALLCMVDETFNFLSPEGVKTDEGKERDQLHMEGQSLLGEIARLGRAAGIHLALATQRPDATVIKGELKNNLDCRIAAGRLDTTPSLMVLDDEGATRLPKIKGRGMIRLGGELQTFQGFFAEQDWIDSFYAAREAGLSGFADDAGSGLVQGGKPKGLLGKVVPAGLSAKMADAVEKRKAAVAANEQQVQQGADGAPPPEAGPKAKKGRKSKPEPALDEPTLDDALLDAEADLAADSTEASPAPEAFEGFPMDVPPLDPDDLTDLDDLPGPDEVTATPPPAPTVADVMASVDPFAAPGSKPWPANQDTAPTSAQDVEADDEDEDESDDGESEGEEASKAPWPTATRKAPRRASRPSGSAEPKPKSSPWPTAPESDQAEVASTGPVNTEAPMPAVEQPVPAAHVPAAPPAMPAAMPAAPVPPAAPAAMPQRPTMPAPPAAPPAMPVAPAAPPAMPVAPAAPAAMPQRPTMPAPPAAPPAMPAAPAAPPAMPQRPAMPAPPAAPPAMPQRPTMPAPPAAPPAMPAPPAAPPAMPQRPAMPPAPPARPAPPPA